MYVLHHDSGFILFFAPFPGAQAEKFIDEINFDNKDTIIWWLCGHLGAVTSNSGLLFDDHR
jgi:hypothetical protein